MDNVTKYDVIIVGGGTMGISAAYHLAKAGRKVLVIDQFTIPNDKASHHGHTRMFRFSNGHGSRYVPLMKTAYELWLELEQETGYELYRTTGAVMAGHANSEYVDEAVESSIEHGVVYEQPSPEEVNERWPGISLPDDYKVCYDPTAGFLYSEACIQAYKEAAVKHGADILENTPVNSIQTEIGIPKVLTARGEYEATHLVVSAGAWIPELLPELRIPLQPVRKTIAWYEPMEPLYDGNFPCFIFDSEHSGRFYGFPKINEDGVKIGRMHGGKDVRASEVDRIFCENEEDEQYLKNALKTFMPQAAGKLNQGRVCLFTMTPDSDFIIDRHPRNSSVLLAGGFSGHGFKYSSAVGKILKELVTDGETTENISHFSIKRFMEKEVGSEIM